MKKSTKAVLLSALVLPGAGHIYLKKYIPGLALAGTALIALYYLVSKATEEALKIVAQMQDGSLPLESTSITDLASLQATGAESQLPDIATVIIIVCWVIGIIDSYRAGLRQDKETSNIK